MTTTAKLKPNLSKIINRSFTKDGDNIWLYKEQFDGEMKFFLKISDSDGQTKLLTACESRADGLKRHLLLTKALMA